MISCRSGSWLKNKVHLCTCKLTKVSMCKYGIGSYMCSKEKLLFKWYMTFERKWWASVTLLDTWHNFSLSASFICNMYNAMSTSLTSQESLRAQFLICYHHCIQLCKTTSHWGILAADTDSHKSTYIEKGRLTKETF